MWALVNKPERTVLQCVCVMSSAPCEHARGAGMTGTVEGVRPQSVRRLPEGSAAAVKPPRSSCCWGLGCLWGPGVPLTVAGRHWSKTDSRARELLAQD